MDDRQLLVRIARLYYEQKKTHAEIGDLIHVSRFTVSRLLQRAQELGIVEIKIHDQWEESELLAEQLCAEFSLKEAIVLIRRERSDTELREGLGYLAANYLDRHLQPGWTLGISWGRTLDSLVAMLQPSEKKAIKVVQMMGHAGLKNPEIDGPDLTRRLAEKYESEYFYLPAPLIVENVKLKEELIKQPSIKEVLAVAHNANIVVSGVGTLDMVDYSVWAGYLTEMDVVNLIKNGAIGHVCGQFFDTQGRLLDIDINKRFIGLNLEEMKQIDHVVCVAGGTSKYPAILGGLRGGLFNVLITDDMVAKEILKAA